MPVDRFSLAQYRLGDPEYTLYEMTTGPSAGGELREPLATYRPLKGTGPGWVISHNEVRLDLRQDDIAKEGRTIRRDVLGPLTRMQFGPGVPVPFFCRQLDGPRDVAKLASVLNVAVNDLHMRIPAQWAHDALGVPLAAEGEATLTECPTE